MSHFRLPRAMVDREQYILNTAKGRKVLHLGCADYPFTESRIADGSWLHAKLSEVASSCLGIDLNENIVETLRNRYGFENICVGDAESLCFLKPKKFDVIVAGELIEHLNNPGLFLESVRQIMAKEGRLIITTINAYCLRRLLRIPFGFESIHPDHICYFSHTTLSTLVKRFDYKQIETLSYRIPSAKPYLPYMIERLAIFISPNLGEGIIHTYSLAN